MEGRDIECIGVTPARCAAPDWAKVSFVTSISAATLRAAINAPYILYAMARTNSLVAVRHSNAG